MEPGDFFNFGYLMFYRCSTIGAIVMTPLLTKLLAGQLVPVDAVVSCCLPTFGDERNAEKSLNFNYIITASCWQAVMKIKHGWHLEVLIILSPNQVKKII